MNKLRISLKIEECRLKGTNLVHPNKMWKNQQKGAGNFACAFMWKKKMKMKKKNREI